MIEKVKIESKANLYYGQFKYAMSWYQDEVGCIRGLNQKTLLQSIRNRMLLEHRRHKTSKFTTRCRDNLEAILVLLKKIKKEIDIKLVCNTNYATVYTNDLTLKDKLQSCNWITMVLIREAKLDQIPDTVTLIHPKRQYRTYFHSIAINDYQKFTITNWIVAQGDEIIPSPSVKSFFGLTTRSGPWSSRYTAQHYYIDHNSLQYETLLQLVCPGLVRKTLPIVKKQ